MEAASFTAYLLSELRKPSCVKASEVSEISHNEINRFLLSNQFTGKYVFEAVKQVLGLEGGVLWGRTRYSTSPSPIPTPPGW